MSCELALGYSHPRFELGAADLRAIEASGVRHVELRITNMEPGASFYDPAHRRGLRQDLDNLGVSRSVHAMAGVNLAEKVHALRSTGLALFVDQLELCAEIGARWLTVHVGTCGFDRNHPKRADRLALAAQSLDELIALTPSSKVLLGLENVERVPDGLRKSYLGDCGADLLELRRGRDARIGFVFDIGHVALNSDADGLELLLALEGALLAAHIHSNDGVEDIHHSLTPEWMAERSAVFKRLFMLSRRGAPLIAEHHDWQAAAATLERLRQAN
jgi:sugar phosphate isomerase/epimerase